MKRLVLFLLVLVSAGTLTVAQDAPESISIGAVIPLTGRYAGGGAQVQRGYELGVQMINDAGGVHVEDLDADLPLELTILDDESDPTKTVSNLEDLNTQGVVAYLGGFGSDLHVAAAAIAEKNEVAYLGVAFALWDIHQQGYRYLFSPFPKSPDLAASTYELLNSIPEADRPTRIGILQEQTDWGIELGTLWRDQAEENGYEVVAYEEYAPGTTDFTDAILSLQENDAQVLLSLPNPPDGIAIASQMAELGYTPELSLIIRAPDAPTWMEALGPAGDYTLFAPGWHNAMDYPGVDELNEAHIALMERPADPIVGPSYALIQILADSIERAGTLDREAIRDAIAATDLDTVMGHITFREDGTGTVTPAILQYQEGRAQLVWPSEFATADLVFPAPPVAERSAATPEAAEVSGGEVIAQAGHWEGGGDGANTETISFTVTEEGTITDLVFSVERASGASCTLYQATSLITVAEGPFTMALYAGPVLRAEFTSETTVSGTYVNPLPCGGMLYEVEDVEDRTWSADWQSE